MIQAMASLEEGEDKITIYYLKAKLNACPKKGCDYLVILMF
jgi:hypothetical protein